MLDTILGRHPAVRRFQSKAAQVLVEAGLDPNRATGLGLASGVLSGVAFALGATAGGIMLLAVSAGFDAIDGVMASRLAAPTLLGGVLDLCADRVVEIFVIIGIAWRHLELYFPALVLVGSWYINITVFLAVGAALGRRGPKLIDYPPGILERSEAIIFLAILAIARPIRPALCYAFVVLEIATGLQRLRFGWRILSRTDAEPS
jgi:phosphatidylglycerophosphate synthase